MEELDLREVVAALMAVHPAHTWQQTGGGGPDFTCTVSPRVDPTRVATVEVVGLELIHLDFMGHLETACAQGCCREEFVELLGQQLALAVRYTQGPTRVVQESADGAVIRSRVELMGIQDSTERIAGMSWPLRGLKARFLRRPTVPVVIDLPALDA